MLLSAVLGLVEEETGRLYYINADNPPLVLLREGTVSLLDEEQYSRKLGIPEANSGIYVCEFQLQSGDTIFGGSDGREDLEIGIDAEGERVIQKKEEAFLQAILQTQGGLNDILRFIRNQGTIVDDISLFKIKFQK